MKTKAVNKKGKKRSLSETSVSTKPDHKNVIESKKKLKKVKTDNSMQNGSPISENKTKVSKKLGKQKNKGENKMTKNIDNIVKSLKTTAKINVKKDIKSTTAESKEEKPSRKQEKKLEHLKRKQLNREFRKVARKQKGQYNPASINLSIEQIKNKIADIKSREVLSKTAKRKLAVLQKKLRIVESGDKSEELDTTENENNEKGKHQPGALVRVKQNVNNKDKTEVGKKRNMKGKKTMIKSKEIDQDESNSEELDSDKDESNEDQSDVEQEIISLTKKLPNVESSEDDEDEEDEEDTNEDKNEENETKIMDVKPKKKKKEDIQVNKALDDKKGKAEKKRYVLFVGNLPFDTTVDELKQHFLTKVDTVTSVRIPTKPGTKTPRGIAYVEVSNSTDYEKGLSLHHSFVKKRRINVQYSAHGSKAGKKADVVAKNKKLVALRKAGKLADDKGKPQKKSSKKGKQNIGGLKA